MEEVMESGIQSLCESAGDNACYFLAICKIGERITGKTFNFEVEAYRSASLGELYLNLKNYKDTDNFFVNKPGELLSRLTGQRWTCMKAEANYQCKPGEWEVERWERSVTGKVIGHFRLPDWDSLQNSQTVKYGKIVSKRIFRKG
jgi:hypothetical protein